MELVSAVHGHLLNAEGPGGEIFELTPVQK
jgi:hypothetical protein